MGRGTWYYSLCVSSIVDASVRSEFEISSWRGARIGVRTYLRDGAIDGGEANGIIRDPRHAMDTLKFTAMPFGLTNAPVHAPTLSLTGPPPGSSMLAAGREDVREVFQQRRSGAKRKLSRCGAIDTRNNSKDLEACLEKKGEGDCLYIATTEGLNMRQSQWMKLFSEYGFEAKYHLGKENVDVVPWSRKKEWSQE
ncbi:hypothetical protein Tco_1414457 [Tanacetum coccineum]